MLSFAERLKAECIRLGLNQDNFAAIGGVTRRTQSQYETGNHSPDAEYLAALAAKGVDIMFVVKGTKVLNYDLHHDERKLVEIYRAATEEQKAALLAVGQAFTHVK